MNDFLPVSKEDMEKAHIRQLDFIYVTGDAYVDHMAIPSVLLHSPTGRTMPASVF